MESSGKSSSVVPTRSAIVRIVVPILGGKEQLGKRAKESEIAEALQFISDVPASTTLSIMDKVDAWFDKKEITPQQRRSDRSRIRPFIEWAHKEIESLQLNRDFSLIASEEFADTEDFPSSKAILNKKQLLRHTIISGFSRNGRQSPHRFRPHYRRFKSPNGTRRKYARDLQLKGKN